MTRRILAAVLCAAVVAPQAAAQPGGRDDENEGDGPEAASTLPTKLTNLVEIAVRLSPELTRARLERSIAIDSADGEDKQAWVFTSNVNWTRNAVADHVDVPAFSTVAEDKLSGSIQIGRMLPTGGQLQFELGANRTDTEYNIYYNPFEQFQIDEAKKNGGMVPETPQEEIVQRNTASLKATFKQPIGRGFGPDVALAPDHRAALQSAQATIKAQITAEEMIKDISIAYWELAYANYVVDTRLQALELARKQEDLTHDQMRAGNVPQTQLNAVEYEIALRKDTLLTSQLELEQKSLELRRKVGLEISRREVLIKPSDPFELDDQEWNTAQVLEAAHKSNRKLANVILERRIADVDVAVANDRIKPQLDLTLSGALQGQGDQTAASLTNLTNADGFEISVGVQLQFEISGAAKKLRDAALNKKRKTDTDRADLERQIDTQVVFAVKQVQAARQRVALQDQAINVADANVRSERASFMAARTTNFEVMKRQGELIEARLRKGRAIADYHIAVTNLQFHNGTLLAAHRVNVRPGGGS